MSNWNIVVHGQIELSSLGVELTRQFNAAARAQNAHVSWSENAGSLSNCEIVEYIFGDHFRSVILARVRVLRPFEPSGKISPRILSSVYCCLQPICNFVNPWI